LSDFTTAALNYQPLLVLWAVRILTATTFLGGAILMVETAQRRDFRGMLDVLFIGLLRIGIVYCILANSLPFGQAIIELGSTVAQQTTGLSTMSLTPSGIVALGSDTVSTFASAGTYMMFLHPIDAIQYAILTLAIRLVWFILAVLYLFTLLQAAWAVAVGPIILSFSTLQWTGACLFLWFEALLTVAIKLMATLLVLAIGMVEAQGWATYFHGLGISINFHPIDYATLALLEVAVFATLLWILPVVAHRMIRMHLGSGMTWDGAGAGSLLTAGKKAAAAIAGAAKTAAKSAAKAA